MLPSMGISGNQAPGRGGAGGSAAPSTAGGGAAGMPARAPMAGMMASAGGPSPMPMAGAPAAGGSGGAPAAGGAGGGTAGRAAGGSGGAPAAGGAGGAAGGGAMATGPKFSEVYPILMMRCAGCHGSAGGLMLGSKDAAHTALMANSTTCMGMKRVVPNMPEMSMLIQALKGMGCRMGRPMPPMPMPMLSEADVKKISDWIAGGAKND